MNALLHPDVCPHVSFKVDHPDQTAVLACRGAGFDFALTFFRQRLRFNLGPAHDAADRELEIGMPPAPEGSEYHLSWETDSTGDDCMVLKRGGAPLLSLMCDFEFDPAFTLETSNITLLHLQRSRHAVAGMVSAPDGRDGLVVVHAEDGYRRAVCGVLEEYMPYGTHVCILAEDAEDALTLDGRGLPRGRLLDDIQSRYGKGIANVTLVAITNPDCTDPEDIAPIISQCAPHSSRMFLGGVVQKVPIEALTGITDTQPPQLESQDAVHPDVTFAAETWRDTVPDALSRGFQWYVPQNLKNMRPALADQITLPRYDVDSALWAVNRFWSVSGWTAPEGGTFTFSWVMHTLFARNGRQPSNAINLLRSTCHLCQAENIRVLGCALLGAQKPTYLLIDVGLLELAVDASYARSQRPLDTYFKAMDDTACASQTLETDELQITLLHQKIAGGQGRHAHVKNAHNTLLENAAKAVRISDSRPAAVPEAARHQQALQDALAVFVMINAIAGDQVFDIAAETLIRFLKTHPQLTVYLSRHVLMHAPPSKISGFMDTLSQANLDLPPDEAQALLQLLIETRVIPMSEEHLWESLPEQSYDDRRWVALQFLEQLPTADYLARAPEVLEQLDLLEEDLAFNEVLAALKSGDLAEAVALGRDSVLRGRLRPENERDMLALALLIEDFDTAATITEALAEPLSPLDRAYRDGVLAARKGKFSTKKRLRCTQDILALDDDFIDLRVQGRTYQTLAEFSTAPDPDTDVICVITAKNEESRLRETMAYHHGIGLRHFILIDNMSSDGTLDLAREYGAMIIQTPESYKDSRYGMAWVNDVLDRHCTGFWSLVVDADEMFVYPDVENRPIQDFVALLEEAGYDAFSCALLDMYPEDPISSFSEVPRGELRALYRFYDAQNAAFWPRLRSPLLGLSGGVRDRAFRMGRFAHLAPIAQTKTPLVKWTKGMKYLTSTHDITPVRSPVFFGALEHYKYTPDFVQRAKREVIRKEHWGQGSEYTAYATVLEADPQMSFLDPRFSHEREASTQLIKTICPFPWPEEML